MIISEFIAEVQSISNPINRSEYLSSQVDLRMRFLEEEYYRKSEEELARLEVDIKGMDLKAMTRALKSNAKHQHRLLMILDNLIKS